MNFPTTGQTAFAAGASAGSLGIYSMIRFSQLLNVRPRSVPELVFFGVFSLLGTAASGGSATAWLRSNENTTPEEYLKNAAHDTAVLTSGMISVTSQMIFKAAVEGVAGAVRESVYEGVRGKDESGRQPSSSNQNPKTE